MDKAKIIKILQKTTTDNDHEALTAIRLANKLLKGDDLHWNEFFSLEGSGNSNVFGAQNDFLVSSLKNKIRQLEERSAALYVNKDKKITSLERKVNELESKVSHLQNKNREKIKSPFIEEFSNPFDRSPKNNISIKDKIDISIDAMPYNAFLHSINDFWIRFGYLTPKQLKALDSIYTNL